MSKRVLAIGVGGSGKAALTILKERVEEAYGKMPDNVVLLSLDTDSLRDVDNFAGVRLNPQFDSNKRLPEFQQIVSPGGVTMDTVFADINSGKTKAWFNWLESDKLATILSPEERDIRGGAQQRRPIGRTALYLRNNVILQAITNSISRMYGTPDNDSNRPSTDADVEKGKRLIFIVGSVAGGTGSGMLIDVANLVRHAIISNMNWQSVSVSAIIVLPDAFASYTTFMNDPTNLKPNSFAALREFDRFNRVHSTFLPYMIRYGESHQGITWSTNQLVDHCYLVDTASRSAVQDFDLSGDPMRGVFPVVADFLMAHVDGSLGDSLATLRSNAGQHNDKSTGRMYSSFNVMTYLFPVNDVITSFSYRFLRELLARVFLPVNDEKRRALLRQEVLGQVENTFTAGTVLGQNNPTVVQKAIVATRRVEPENPDMSWAGLFGLISLSDSGFAEDYQYLQDSLGYLEGGLALTKDGEFKRESFDDGASRLFNFTNQFLDDYIGPQLDPNDPDSRTGGYWDQVLQKYREALRIRFAEVLDAQIIDVMNRRDDGNKILLPNRLPTAREMVSILKGHLTAFKARLIDEWQRQGVETQLRQVSEEVRNNIAWVNETRNGRYFPPLFTDPRKAQEGFTTQFVDYIRLVLHRRVYYTVLDAIDSLGAADSDRDRQDSIIERAAVELENWEHTFRDVDQILVEGTRQHNANRDRKRSVKVRRYLTNAEFEDQLYKRREHAPAVAMRIMGQVGAQKGIEFKRQNELRALDYKLFTTWGDDAAGAEAIVRTWMAGARDVFQVVRNNVTVAERLAAEFSGDHQLANKALEVSEPFLRYNPSKNDIAMFAERYISFNVEKAQEDAARTLLNGAAQILGGQGYNVDSKSETVVACTVLQVSRGARLDAVEPYVQSEPEYRAKIDRGSESLHLFPEEQYATEMERAIPTLGETNNSKRALSPELVIAMGDPNKFRAFTFACAYGLVEEGSFRDPETGEGSIELYLRLNSDRRLPMSQSRIVAGQVANFDQLSASERIARLYLNALQNFMLKMTEPLGFNINLVAQTKSELQRRGVPLAGIETPLTLALRDVNDAIDTKIKMMGESVRGLSDPRMEEAQNAHARANALAAFVQDKIKSLKTSQDARVRDMATIMHLVLNSEIDSLKHLADPKNASAVQQSSNSGKQ